MGQNQGRDARQLTVIGLGSRILLINFFALEENQGGHEKSALFICIVSNPITVIYIKIYQSKDAMLEWNLQATN